MNCKIEIIPRLLHFKRPAGTSRGVYTTRKVWYVRLTSSDLPEREGIGECAPLPQLSCDDRPDYEALLSSVCRGIEESGGAFNPEELFEYPSIAFGLETAFRHFEAGSLAFGPFETGSQAFEQTSFARGEVGIPINGLIWMGDYQYMYDQIKTKVESGFRCVKLKIGAIHFEEELNLLSYIRQQFTSRDIELRVDANGAFSSQEALQKLNRLSEYDIHSIEQPIRAGQWEAMARLVEQTPIPIALDEELIGCNDNRQRRLLLETIRPHYIIIKPSLHSDRDEWIRQATLRGIGWWATSALESNIGLNAIAQWVSAYSTTLPQGLGTGALFTKNVKVPLRIEKDELWYDPQHPNGGFSARWKQYGS